MSAGFGFGITVVVDGEFRGIVHGRIGKRHQLVEYGKFELQLDTINHGLERGFDFVIPSVFHDQQDDVHTDDDAVDPNQLHHYVSRSAMVDRLEQFESRPNVDTRNDELLDAKGRHLQPLDGVECGRVLFRRVRVRAIGEDGRGNMEADGVHDDHDQYRSKDLVVPHHQMQSRI